MSGMTQSPMYPLGMADLPRRNEAVDHVDHVGCQLCGCGKAHPTPHKSRLQSRPRNATASVAKGSNDYISRRATGIQRLRKEGVNLHTIPDVEGYFFLQYNLTAEHKERVLGAMPDERFGLADLKRVALPPTPDMHRQEQPRYETPRGSGRGRFTPSRHGARTGARPMLAATAETAEEPAEEEPEEPGEEFDQGDFQVLSGANSQNDDELLDPEAAGEVDQAVPDAPEAFALVRHTRAQIAERRSNKGRGRAIGKGRDGALWEGLTRPWPIRKLLDPYGHCCKEGLFHLPSLRPMWPLGRGPTMPRQAHRWTEQSTWTADPP